MSNSLNKLEQKTAAFNHGKTPADSDASQLKSMAQKGRPHPNEKTKNLPLPDDPLPGRGQTMESADARTSEEVGLKEAGGRGEGSMAYSKTKVDDDRAA